MKSSYIFLLFLSEISEGVKKTSGLTQDRGVMTARVGGTVTLNCSHTNDVVTYLYWYQQHLGGKPDVISTRMRNNPGAVISPAFKERFKVDAKSANNLMIYDLQASDSATYYCGISEFAEVEFGEGVFLHVKSSSSNMKPAVYQPVLELLRVGDSVNLSCSVSSEACAEEQSFYWFRHGAAQPAVMDHSEGQCSTDSGSNMKNCTLNLSLKSVSFSDAGIYYCALAACGEIVFGNGTKLQIKGSFTRPPLLVCGLSVALAVSIVLLLILAFIMYKLTKELCSGCKGAVSHSAGSATSDATSQDAESLHYAALSVNRSSEQHRPEGSSQTACVYSSVKSRKK